MAMNLKNYSSLNAVWNEYDFFPFISYREWIPRLKVFRKKIGWKQIFRFEFVENIQLFRIGEVDNL